jgi:5'-methylthioadenosine phosphorylase
MSHPTLDFKRAYLALRRALEQTIKPFDFSVAQFDVLQLLLHHDGLEHGDLQRRLAIASPTLSNILDRMERDGHVQRRGDSRDGRVKRIYLGKRAREICSSAEFCDAGDELVNRMFRGFSEPERKLFLKLLTRVEKNLDES